MINSFNKEMTCNIAASSKLLLVTWTINIVMTKETKYKISCIPIIISKDVGECSTITVDTTIEVTATEEEKNNGNESYFF